MRDGVKIWKTIKLRHEEISKRFASFDIYITIEER